MCPLPPGSWSEVVGRDLPDDAVERVHTRTGGNPLFVGEMGRVLAAGARKRVS